MLLNELGTPLFQGRQVVTGQRLQAEGEKFVDIQGAGLVFIVKILIFIGKLLAIHLALIDQELAPFIVAVTVQQGVVQVKDR